MSLADCGAAFHVPQKPERPWTILLLVCAMLLTLVLLVDVRLVALLPYGIVIGAMAHRIGARARVVYVLVAKDRIAIGARSISFTEIRSVRLRGTRVIIRGASCALAFDTSLLDSFARLCLVRHIEARMLLAQSARRRTRAERVALEAFHVFRGATAVRIHKRAVVELFEGEGPWVSSRRGSLYARSVGAPTTAYRTNARINAIEVGSLQ